MPTKKTTKKPASRPKAKAPVTAVDRVALQSKQPTAKPLKPKKPAKVIHPKAHMSFRKNIMPPILGILMFAGVMGLLNGQWLQAQYQYRFATAATVSSVAANPVATDPNAPAQLYIPRIDVSAPLVTDVKSYDSAAVQLGLRRGPLQYGSSADPGQKGNIVVVGHSSGQLWAPGNYKFIFTLLDKLSVNDRIIIDFKGQRFIYRVNETKIVPPTDLSVLRPTDEPQLTLITCTPVGTSKNRLIVTARQVSPNPTTAIDIGQNKSINTSAIPN